MLDVLPTSAIAELERALRLRLFPSARPMDERVVELGFLAELLAELLPPASRDPEGAAPRRIDRTIYDTRRPAEAPGAPPSARLVERYGSWMNASRAADGLLADGRYLGTSKPWRTPARGQARADVYTREEVRAAIRACALELGCRPTANVYYEWARRKRARARQIGAQARRGEIPRAPRIPTLRSIYRLYPDGENRWSRAVDDAAITDAQVAEARQRRFSSSDASAETEPAASISDLTPVDLERLGLSEVEMKAIEGSGFGALPISKAVAIAQELGGSLDWLAGLVPERGQTVAPTAVFDAGEFSRRRRERGLAEAAVRGALGLGLGPYRRLLSGRDEPSLGQLTLLAGLLGIDSGLLVAS
jgi:hypothetical protein